MDEKLINALIHSRIPRIVYVSCDPGTLARDVKRLSSAYQLIQAQPVDMFPFTSHVETVILLSRKDAHEKMGKDKSD